MPDAFDRVLPQARDYAAQGPESVEETLHKLGIKRASLFHRVLNRVRLFLGRKLDA